MCKNSRVKLSLKMHVSNIKSMGPLVLEKFDDLRSMIGEWLIVSEMESGKIHKIYGNLTVNKIGKMILKREFKKL